MHLTELTLRDFGVDVFQDARMEKLDGGLVVVGGPQRAGKTTLLGAIRRLGYGIESDADLPSPADEYNIRATLQHEGNEYVLKVRGHGEPTLISTGQGPDRDIENLFGSVSKRQYQQLFTITLDELKRIPDSIDDPEDLSEVLLGAAYGDLAVIPEMQETFRQRAYDIGRKYGKPTKNSELRNPMDTIDQGIEDRDDALAQVDEWGEVTEELESIEARISELQSENERLTHKVERLRVVADSFTELRTYQELRSKLEDEDDVALAKAMPDDARSRVESLRESFDETVSQRDELRSELEKRSPDGDSNAYKRNLLSSERTISECDRQIAKWENEARQIQEREAELEKDREDLEQRVSQIHPDWSRDFEPILDVQTDTLAEGDLQSTVEQYKRATEDLEEAKSDLQKAESRIESLEAQLGDEPSSPESQDSHLGLLGKTGAVGILSLTIAVGSAIGGFPAIGGVLGALTLVAGLYVVIPKSNPETTEVNTRRELKNQIQRAENDANSAQSAIEDAELRRDEAITDLAECKSELGLPQDVSPESTLKFYEEVADCKRDVLELQSHETAVQERRENLEEELTEAAESIAEVRHVTWNDSQPIARLGQLVAAVEAASEDIEDAKKLETVETTLSDVEDDIAVFVDDWKRLEEIEPTDLSADALNARLDEILSRVEQCEVILDDIDRRDTIEQNLRHKLQTGSTEEAFAAVRNSEEDPVAVLERIAEGFEESAEVTAALSDTSEELEETDELLKSKQKESIRLENELERLKSDDDIVEARRQISEGREELRELGEEYAVNRIAENLTKRLHERFIGEVAGPLIDEASRIFERITQEYEGIDHNDRFDDLDFEALRDGKSSHSSNELSRATAEQLFLAVRLARIRQLDVSLPVVIDDAITNFDPSHGARTLQTVSELANTNQVFLLTCHPENVMLAETYGDASQYWCLEEGRFTGPLDTSEEVYSLLSADKGSAPRAD